MDNFTFFHSMSKFNNIKFFIIKILNILCITELMP
jgi:hypothetical protein